MMMMTREKESSTVININIYQAKKFLQRQTFDTSPMQEGTLSYIEGPRIPMLNFLVVLLILQFMTMHYLSNHR